MLVSGVQQSDSVLYIYYIYIYLILFQIPFPYRLLQNIEYSSYILLLFKKYLGTVGFESYQTWHHFIADMKMCMYV